MLRFFIFFVITILNTLDESTITVHDKHDAYKGEEDHRNCHNSKTSSKGVGGLDPLGLLGNMIMESGCGGDVFKSIGQADKVKIVAYGVFPYYNDFIIRTVDLESVRGVIESLAGDCLEGVKAMLVGTFDRLHTNYRKE